MKSWFLWLLFFCVLSSCTTIAPVAPEEAHETFEFRPEASEIIAPVRISLRGLENSIDKNLRNLLYEDNDLSDDNLEIKVWKKDKVKISATGNVLSYSIPLKIWLRTELSVGAFSLGEPKEAQFSLIVRFKSRVNIDKNWKVETITQEDGFEWIDEPSLKLAGIEFSIAPLASGIVKKQLKNFAPRIDEEAAKNLNIRDRISTAWKDLQIPMKVSSNPETWMKIVPASISVAPIKGNSESISTVLGIKAFTETSIGERPQVTRVRALPELAFNDYPGGFFSISLVADIPYEKATVLVAQSLVGQEYTFGKKGKKKITIRDLEIFPGKGKLVVKTQVEGSLNGTLYLTGVPYFDPQSEKLIMKNLDFDLDTRNKVLKSANWLVHGLFLKKLEPYFQYDLSQQLAENRQVVASAVNNRNIGDHILLQGQLDRLNPEKVFLTEGSIKALISASGKLNLEITGF